MHIYVSPILNFLQPRCDVQESNLPPLGPYDNRCSSARERARGSRTDLTERSAAELTSRKRADKRVRLGAIRERGNPGTTTRPERVSPGRRPRVEVVIE